MKPGIFKPVNAQSKILPRKGTYEIQEIVYHFKVSILLLFAI